MGNVINEVAKIFSHLNQIMAECNASHVVLLKASNGGSIPRPGCKLYSSVIYEVYGPSSTSVLKSWQDQPLDQQYIHMLMDVKQHGETQIIIDEMDEGILRNLYLSKGIKMSKVVKLLDIEGAFYYLSIVWAHGDSISEEELGRIDNIIRVGKNNIFSVLKKGQP